ncbi:DinB family protein [Phytohabitans kaempferiae]|uniref:DinB family protein n=1 Tax=Phytohabitans kaempferiae TaxID=1620943 RepID=A0ABV6M658_9ACTN
MTWIAPDIERRDEPTAGGERAMLQGWLDYHRDTLLFKCQGLTAAQLKLRSVEPSSLSLLGLVRHMADVERSWFRQRFLGADLPRLYWSDDNPDGDFDDIDAADPAADFAIYRKEVRLADEAAAGRSLDETFHHRQRDLEISLRWVYLHMIEEYARHNGHADLIRERIDGVTGD